MPAAWWKSRAWIHREIDIAARDGGRRRSWWTPAGTATSSAAGGSGVGDWRVGDWLPGGLAACRDLVPASTACCSVCGWSRRRMGPKSQAAAGAPGLAACARMTAAKSPRLLDLAHPEAAAFSNAKCCASSASTGWTSSRSTTTCRIHEGGQRERHGVRRERGLAALRSPVRHVRPGPPRDAGRGPGVLRQRRRAQRPGHDVAVPLCLRVGLLDVPPQHPRDQRTDPVPAARGAVLLPQPHAHGAPEGRSGHPPAGDAVRPADLRGLRRAGCRPRQPVLPTRPGGTSSCTKASAGRCWRGSRWCITTRRTSACTRRRRGACWRYALADRSRGYAGVFRLASGDEEYRLRLRGVAASGEYEVTLDNPRQTFRMSGRELAMQGLAVRLDAAMTSELVMYTKVGDVGRRDEV